MGLVKRLVKMRASKLKVLITSATLDGEKVSEFFSDCPVLNVPGKLYPVEILYSEERPKSYIESSFRTAMDIHVREPEGDVLIFMTGQDDIDKLVSKLEDRVQSLEEGSCMDAIILPLHGSLPPELQVRVFSPPPPNCRRFIVATNIAETSLTVDGVVYVIDSGYVKQRQYNPSTGMYSLDIVQISKVQANQRAGRAGRTRPGKCYRLYSSEVYQEELLDVTVPEIQRSSLAGSVLYLKSLDLPDIDILKFDFLDPPSFESLEDALKQLYLIDAIDDTGLITSVGQTMAELPLEPSLSRTLMEANENGCLSQALTVAAMLSAETTLLAGQSSKNNEKKRKHPPPDLPDGSGYGDHVQLLQIFEQWDQNEFDIGWCKDKGLQVRGMMFVKDVRRQLSQLMQKIAKGSLNVRTNERYKERQRDYKNLRKALCVGYANKLAERMVQHNGYRTIGFKPQLVQVHPSSTLKTDEDGMFPNYVVYHELIATSRPFMRNVCAVEMPWVNPILKKLEKLNIDKLSGGSGHSIREESETKVSSLPKKEEAVTGVPDDRESRIQAARDRFLARKGKK
ncbi:probable pre-mRNA-splicing factor ATP-dependent RNA helicase DEAH4 isoform X2 [Populus nigra]|nr:probable pre-mRNA-splicing factor ATP-dependent RNA helicase DEAH4 isoform X2 [Populus nigra]